MQEHAPERGEEKKIAANQRLRGRLENWGLRRKINIGTPKLRQFDL